MVSIRASCCSLDFLVKSVVFLSTAPYALLESSRDAPNSRFLLKPSTSPSLNLPICPVSLLKLACVSSACILNSRDLSATASSRSTTSPAIPLNSLSTPELLANSVNAADEFPRPTNASPNSSTAADMSLTPLLDFSRSEPTTSEAEITPNMSATFAASSGPKL